MDIMEIISKHGYHSVGVSIL